MSRSVSNILSCRSCQRMLYAAVTPSASAIRALPVPRRSLLRPQIHPRRFHSSDTLSVPVQSIDKEEKDQADVETEDAEQPWFLDVEPPKHPPSQHIAQLPKAPEDAPGILDPIIQYIYEDMGLDEISLLDLRDLDPPVSLGPNLIMLFASARGERHLHISSGRFVRWLRKNHKVNAGADGLIGPGELRKKLRRLRKKAKLLGSNTAMVPEGDHGISTGWVCVHFDLKTSGSGEGAKVDDSGQISGFGSSGIGTTVVIQCMTESRRSELDLESFWKETLQDHLEQAARLREGDKSGLNKALSEKAQINLSPADAQWAAMKRASQRKYFSTSARQQQHVSNQPSSSTADDSMPPSALNTSPPPPLPTDQYEIPWTFEAYRQEALDIRLKGRDLTQESLPIMLDCLLRTPSDIKQNGIERLVIINKLLQTAEERGLDIRCRSVLVALIESTLYCDDYGPELRRAQRNLEYLLKLVHVAPKWQETVRLMAAYASREEWDKVWYAFREPARYALPREPQIYIMAFNIAAGTNDEKMCRDVLRWVYTDMLNEVPPIKIDKVIYNCINACIDIADPEARDVYENPTAIDRSDTIVNRQLQNKEFLRLLVEVERAWIDPYNRSMPDMSMSIEDALLFRRALFERPKLPAVKQDTAFSEEESKDHSFFQEIL